MSARIVEFPCKVQFKLPKGSEARTMKAFKRLITEEGLIAQFDTGSAEPLTIHIFPDVSRAIDMRTN